MTNDRAWEIYSEVYDEWASTTPSSVEDWNAQVADSIRAACEAESDEEAAALLVERGWYEYTKHDARVALRHARKIRRLAQ